MYRGGLATSADPALKTKTCPRCRRPLSIEEFDPNRARRDGRQTHCRRCRKRQRDQLRNGNGRANRSGHARTNGNGSSLKHEDEEEEREGEGSYTPTWKKPKISRKELLIQRERYMNIINAASLALERIEMRLGIANVEGPDEEESQGKEPAEIQEDLAEDLEDDLG